MPYCRNCGTEMPEDARFCPSCGATVEAKAPATPEAAENIFRYVVVGLLGGFLSVMITLFSGETDLVFIPSFVASIIVIFMYRISELKDSLIASLSIYLFAEGILGALVLGYSYAFQTPYEVIWEPQIWEVALYSFTPISAILAAYIGVKMGPKKKEQVLVSSRRREGPGGVIYGV
jgi:hypothetical protein